MVKIKFFGVLVNKMPEKDDKGFWIVDGAGKPIKELLDLSLLKDTNIKYTLFVNNERQDINYVLEDNDVLTVLPLLAGG